MSDVWRDDRIVHDVEKAAEDGKTAGPAGVVESGRIIRAWRQPDKFGSLRGEGQTGCGRVEMRIIVFQTNKVMVDGELVSAQRAIEIIEQFNIDDYRPWYQPRTIRERGINVRIFPTRRTITKGRR